MKMIKKRQSNEHGFVLLEVLISLPLVSLLITAISMLFLFGMKQYFGELSKVELQQELQTSMNRITDDLHKAHAIEPKTGKDTMHIIKQAGPSSSGGKLTYHLNTVQGVCKLVQGKDDAGPMTGNHAMAQVTITDFSWQEEQGLVHLHLAGETKGKGETYEVSTAVFIPSATK